MNLTAFRKSKYAREPHFLLFGNPVSHSLSPVMHNLASKYYGMDAVYHAIQLEQSELSTLAAHLNSDFFKGANITIPYKEVLLEYVDALDPTARNIGAINTLVIEDMRLIGYNTDSYGFSAPLKEYSDELMGGRAVIFGTGGATKAIINALMEFDMEEMVLISRNPQKRKALSMEEGLRIESYDAWFALAGEAALIVNATPLGMNPDTASCPIRNDEKEVLSDKICYDIVYNPLETRFLKLAKSAGARTIGGLDMLIHQGSKSYELWTGKKFPIGDVKKKLNDVIQQRA